MILPIKIIIADSNSPLYTELPFKKPLLNQSFIKKAATTIGKTISKGVSIISVLTTFKLL